MEKFQKKDYDYSCCPFPDDWPRYDKLKQVVWNNVDLSPAERDALHRELVNRLGL